MPPWRSCAKVAAYAEPLRVGVVPEEPSYPRSIHVLWTHQWTAADPMFQQRKITITSWTGIQALFKITTDDGAYCRWNNRQASRPHTSIQKYSIPLFSQHSQPNLADPSGVNVASRPTTTKGPYSVYLVRSTYTRRVIPQRCQETSPAFCAQNLPPDRS